MLAAVACGVRPADAQHPRPRILSATASRTAARKSTGYRVVVSLAARRLHVISGADTLLEAPVAIGSGDTLRFGGTRWAFITPRGVRYVLAKSSNPVWLPPEWVYASVAKANGFKLRHLAEGDEVRLRDGRVLAVRDGVVGLIEGDTLFDDLPMDEHIVFDGTLFVPPPTTRNRHVEGELGKFKLDLGDGYFLHGTPDKASIGEAVTHGCLRLADADIEWLYDRVPIGTPVYIY